MNSRIFLEKSEGVVKSPTHVITLILFLLFSGKGDKNDLVSYGFFRKEKKNFVKMLPTSQYSYFNAQENKKKREKKKTMSYISQHTIKNDYSIGKEKVKVSSLLP